MVYRDVNFHFIGPSTLLLPLRCHRREALSYPIQHLNKIKSVQDSGIHKCATIFNKYTKRDSSRRGSNENTTNNRGNHQYNRNNLGYLKKVTAKKFEGRSDELKGGVYDFTNTK